MSVIKWLLFLPTNLFGGALAQLGVLRMRKYELLLAAYAKHAATTTKGEHHARQN